MATMHSAPIDLYEESREGFTEEQHEQTHGVEPPEARPAFNGDRDEPAIAGSQYGLERVLGW